MKGMDRRLAAPALAGFLLLGAPYTAMAQSPAAPPDTAGWTAPGSPATPADSLPAFRPDSLKDEVYRSAESAPSPFAARAPARDSADSVSVLLRARRPAVSVHLGLNFSDLDAKDEFAGALESRRRRDSLNLLQPYEPVPIAIPIGLQAIVPVGTWFDLVAKTHSYWYRQSALLGGATGAPGEETQAEESYAVQAHLGGAGLRYYLPPDLLSVTGKLGIYVQGLYYWLLGGGEIYTPRGSAPARFNPAGSAWEIQAGFTRAMRKPIGISGSLGFLQQGYTSDRPWSALLSDNAPAGKVRWSSGSLQATVNLWYNFGVKPPPARAPAPAPPSPTATP